VLSTGEKLLITQAAKRLVVADQLGDWILGQLEGPKDGHLLAQMLVWDGMGRTVTAMLKFNGRCAPPGDAAGCPPARPGYYGGQDRKEDP
jgi:hypothetical protein